jgi:nicotinate phosphoribosyltransferase
MKSSRAFHIAGVEATSNVLAAMVYGVPIAGTMAHSYIQAHDDELDAFRRFAAQYPETVLLVDTYDTLDGVRKVVRLARELGDAFRVTGIRLDSGDLSTLAFDARRILDEAGLSRVRIVASSGLDEYEIARLVDSGAPINGFGVGTAMGVSADCPSLDLVYKLTTYQGRGRLKNSPGKRTYPGRKQVFRHEARGQFVRDILARDTEQLEGAPLLRPVMRRGTLLPGSSESLAIIRQRVTEQKARLPDALHALTPVPQPYSVELSDALRQYDRESAGRLGVGLRS